MLQRREKKTFSTNPKRNKSLAQKLISKVQCLLPSAFLKRKDDGCCGFDARDTLESGCPDAFVKMSPKT
jgi:hypothetical protein